MLNQLPAPVGQKNRKRLGRGESSGHGKTSGRGHKGQKSRSGGYHKLGFEGGQMPLQRRLPKRGFTPLKHKMYAIVNVGQLNGLPAHTEVDEGVLIEAGLVRKIRDGVKILGKGDLKNPLVFKLSLLSQSARAKIVEAGGKIMS